MLHLVQELNAIGDLHAPLLQRLANLTLVQGPRIPPDQVRPHHRTQCTDVTALWLTFLPSFLLYAFDI